MRAGHRSTAARRPATGERIDIEFVSANPTGPLTRRRHGANALFGDAVARLLEATGHRVAREYYINDFGNQVRLFAAERRAPSPRGRDVPEDGYKARVRQGAGRVPEGQARRADRGRSRHARAALHGVHDVRHPRLEHAARHPPDARGPRRPLRRVVQRGVAAPLGRASEMALEKLDRAGYLEKKDGAIFFVGKGAAADDKDRVVKKSDGDYTYFASDIAYHADKVGRGYDRLINVLGADHHGYVARVRNAHRGAGLAERALRGAALPAGLHLPRRRAREVGKRAGNVITIDEIMRGDRRGGGHAGRRARRAALLLPVAHAPTRTSSSTSSSPRRRASTTRSSTCSTATRGSARS